MRPLQRLYLKEFIVLLLIASIVLSTLFSLVSVIENMDEILPLGIGGRGFILVGLAKIPHFLGYLLPMAALLCAIFVISLASRRNELIVVKASGGNMREFFTPFLMAGLLLVLVNFFIAEVISPLALKKSNAIMYPRASGKDLSYQEGNIWFKGKDGVIVKTRFFLPEEQELVGISLLFIEKGRLQKRIEAEKGTLTEEGWRLRKARLYDLDSNTVTILDETLIPGVGEPELLEREKERISEMGVFDLFGYLKGLEEAGYRNINLGVDVQSKLAYPFSNIFMVLIGLFLSLRSRSGRGIVSAGAGILICFFYWFAFTMTLSLGYAGIIPPLVAAWTVPVLSAAAGSFVYLKIPL